MFFSLSYSSPISSPIFKVRCARDPWSLLEFDILSATNIMLDRLAMACGNAREAIFPLSDKLLAYSYKELPSLSQQSHQVSESASYSSSLSCCCAFFFILFFLSLLLFSGFSSIIMLLLFTHSLLYRKHGTTKAY